ncbi:hypothetical protein EP073_01305 [Geovibrio thiophilus]|uniref:Cysteine-rich CWC family protein n=1 Tax=Geovibrio thiophilus TaxID=139438 RepID=A0A410JVL9_9BACT|nr:cysteine-rich CWC family protein [Geovibrio thiophilus]QAR32085.1 hypothetical protein EP073_01305 [Geovibrio thiophilus]
MRESADKCPMCGQDNKCAALKKSNGTCWCVGKPPLPSEILTQYEWRPCFCENCYDKIIAQSKQNQQ